MSKITKELAQSVSDLKAGYTLGHTDVAILNELARIALASLEAEAVPDERYQHLSELYHAQEKRLFKLAQRIKGPAFDKYAHSTSQAIDVLESAIFGEREDDCRAAMLQGADGNSPVIHDGYAEMLQRWLTFGRGMQKAGSQLPRNLIDETEAMIAAAPQQEVK